MDKKIFFIVFMIIAMLGVASALPTTYSPFTGKLDFYGFGEDIRDFVDTWFYSDSGDLEFNETHLNTTLDTRYVNINGDNTTGLFNFDGTINASKLCLYNETICLEKWNQITPIFINFTDNETISSIAALEGQALVYDETHDLYQNEFVRAQYVPIVDDGAFFVSTDTEEALQELAGSINLGNSSSTWKKSVISKSVLSPPLTPDTGDRYIIPFTVGGDWYGAAGAWDYRQSLTIESDQVEANQTNFPVTILVTDSANTMFGKAQSDGDDIVFTSSDKTTKLSHELVYYNDSVGGKYLEAHVNIPVVANLSDTILYMYYGNGVATSQEDTLSTWDSDYEAVFHMENLAATTINDSTGVYIGDLENGVSKTTGILSSAQSFDGSNDYADTNINTDLPAGGAFTVSVWVKDITAGSRYMVTQGDQLSSYSSSFILGWVNHGGWFNGKNIAGSNAFTDGAWHQTTLVYDGTNGKLLIDGVQYGGTVTPAFTPTVTSVKLMANGIGGNPVSGTMDEVRISTIQRSDEWINTEYENIKNIDTFLSFGTEEISAATATEWTGSENNITTYNSTNWTFDTPMLGWAVIVEDEAAGYTWNGTDWVGVESPIIHDNTQGVKNCDANGNCNHLSDSLYAQAVRIATNALSGIMPAGKLDYWNNKFTPGEDLEENLKIVKVSPNIILEDSTDDTSYKISYNSSESALNITRGNMVEGEFNLTPGGANLYVDGNGEFNGDLTVDGDNKFKLGTPTTNLNITITDFNFSGLIPDTMIEIIQLIGHASEQSVIGAVDFRALALGRTILLDADIGGSDNPGIAFGLINKSISDNYITALKTFEFDIATDRYTFDDEVYVDGIVNATGDICIEGGNCLSESTSTYNQSYAGSLNNASYLSTYNATYASTTGDNASWNETYADTLYAGSEWGYNQTTETYTLYNDKWSSTYNATYAAGGTGDNVSWNQTFATTLFIPYEGATDNVNLGDYNISASNANVTEKIILADWSFSEDDSALTFNRRTSDTSANFVLRNVDGDKTDDSLLFIYGEVETHGDTILRESLTMGWRAAVQRFVIETTAAGTGILQDINMKTGDANIFFDPDGYIGIGTTSPTTLGLELGANQSLNITDGYLCVGDIGGADCLGTTDGYIYADDMCLNDGSCLSAVNSDNSSWNQTFANTLYAEIKWGYNQTTATYDLYNGVWISTYNESYAGSLNNASYLSTYNATYDGHTQNNNSWNETLANTLYSDIEWGYNQTIPANEYTDETNSSMTSWIDTIFLKIADMFTKEEITGMIDGNLTEAKTYTNTVIAGNESAWTSTYNQSYAGSLNNASYLSTYNATYDGYVSGGDFSFSDFQGSFDTNWSALDYDKWMYNQTYSGSTYNATYADHEQNNNSWNQTYANDLYTNADGDNVTGFLNSSGDIDAQMINARGDLQVNGLNLSSTGLDHTSGADLIGIPVLNGATYTSVHESFNLFSSAGRITGGNISLGGNSDINISAGTGFIKATDDDTAELMSFDWDAVGEFTVPINTIMYYGIDYNAGSPIITNMTTDTWDLDTQFPLGHVINQGGELYILNNPWWVGDGLTNMIEKSEGIAGHLARDKEVGGLILGVSGTRNPTMSAGTLWGRTNEFEIPEFDSTGTDTFDTYYRDGSGGYSEIPDQTQYNITHYDDGDGGLEPIGNNKYAVIWVWINAASKEITMAYPQATYVSSAGAEAEEIPNTYLAMWYESGLIIGRIIIKEGVDAPVQVQSSFTQTFTAAQAADHGNLAGLGDDDHTQYLLTTGTRTATGNVSTTSWFNGLFNWTVLTNWFSFDGATLSFNETKLNDTIEMRGLAAGFNSTYNATYAASTGGNASWNETRANELYVPYTGATSNVDLGINNITANIGSTFGNLSRYLSFGIFDLSGIGYGYYSTIKGVSNGPIGNATLVENVLAILGNTETTGLSAGQDPTISLTDANNLEGGKISYNSSLDKMSFAEADLYSFDGDVNSSTDFCITGGSCLTTALQSLLSDTTPQLGGYLDTNGENIGATDDEIENIYVAEDSRTYYGNAQESSIYFNGTDLVIEVS